MTERLMTDLKAAIRSIPDYPKPGVVFRDITTLLGDARSFRRAVDEMRRVRLPVPRNPSLSDACILQRACGRSRWWISVCLARTSRKVWARRCCGM